MSPKLYLTVKKEGQYSLIPRRARAVTCVKRSHQLQLFSHCNFSVGKRYGELLNNHLPIDFLALGLIASFTQLRLAPAARSAHSLKEAKNADIWIIRLTISCHAV